MFFVVQLEEPWSLDVFSVHSVCGIIGNWRSGMHKQDDDIFSFVSIITPLLHYFIIPKALKCM
jgi:ammonia channel protein AmtB